MLELGFEECVGVYHVKGENGESFFRQEVQTKLRL